MTWSRPLSGRRLLITGLATRESLAWSVARAAQLGGAEVLLSSHGRMRSLTERAAGSLPQQVDIVELDVNNPDDLAGLPAEIDRRWNGLDGIVHAVAAAPPGALNGRFLETSAADALATFQTSAFSLKALAAAARPCLCRPRNTETTSIVALSFASSVAWPSYDWMGVAKAALESVARYLARDLGRDGVRVNVVASGPIHTVAADQIPDFAAIDASYRERAPLGWDSSDAGPVADVVCYLLSNLARGMTGQILQVDGGSGAIGCGVPDA